ncbi:AAA family ATPase [Candidatus Saccharibacteria bacterium]|nr:AAA family ATPase [Candidatus Saccharibacteria bacterium]
MIKAIQINSETEYIDEKGEPLYALYDLGRINIFIGANNCGKSRLMRRLFNSESVIAISETKGLGRYDSLRREIRSLLGERDRINGFSGLPKLLLDSRQINDQLERQDCYGLYKYLTVTINEWFGEVRKNKNWETRSNYISPLNQGLSSILTILRYNVAPFNGSTKLQNSVYIPTLRGIENFDSYFDKTPIEKIKDARLSREEWSLIDEYASNAKMIYLNKISKAYSIDSRVIFTAENLYEDIRRKLLGHEADRKKISDFQKFISDNFYDGKEFSLIPIEKINNNKTERYIAVKIGAKQERKLYDLGDGIKQLITILYAIYTRKDQEGYFFIEEPEINLHPGYQTKLIDLLEDSCFDRLQFFIVTHSNHLLSSAISSEKTSVYKVSSTEKPDIFRVSQTTARDFDIIGLLGAKNASMLMSNCAIFVEGISDKIYLKRYLELYFKEKGIKFEEDINYTFVETGGANISHWSFVDSIEEKDLATIHAASFSKNSFIICDNDGGKRKQRKEKLEKMVGEENFYVLPVREIENLLKREVLEKIIFNNEKPILKKQYNNNQRDGYAQKYLGAFIDEHYETGKKYAATRSGTIKDKVPFARSAIKYLDSYEDMSTSAIELCEKIANFIIKSNT